jgi:hypothetical protein
MIIGTISYLVYVAAQLLALERNAHKDTAFL